MRPIIAATLKALVTIAAAEVAKAAVKKVMKSNREPPRDPSIEELEQIIKELIKELTRELSGEFQKQQQKTTKGLIEEFQKQQQQLAVLVGIVCLILGGLVGSSVTWYVLQPGQPSEQIISLEELDKYEKARDAGLQALEAYVIQNPNSPYISQAKDQIRVHKGEE